MTMTMKTIHQNRTLTLSILGLNLGLALALTTFSNSAEARSREDRRQTRQSVRIQEGRASDDLTRTELKQTRKSGKAIRRAERRFENNDGEIGAKEAKALENMQDARSRQIQRLKNNDRVQGDGAVIANPPVTQPVEPPAAE
jgi:hypothetical protein